MKFRGDSQSSTMTETHGYEEVMNEAKKDDKQVRFNNRLKVYVKNLPLADEFSNKLVIELCEPCGTIQHTHFFEKTLAGQRINQGLLVFSSEGEAIKAAALTGSLVCGRHIIVSRCHQYAQPSDKTVYVSNLTLDTNEEDLWQFFEKHGSIQFIHIDRPLNASSLKGEVHFKVADEAQKVLRLENGKKLKGNKILVSGMYDMEEEDQQHLTTKEFAVFVAGLPQDIKKESLIEFFDGCGPIKRIKIKSKGDAEDAHATIFFMDCESAENAIAYDGNDISGYVISVRQREETLTYENPVFIAGIARATKNVDLFLKFQDCGLISSIKFVKSKPHSLKKCVIEFKEPEAVDKALVMEDLEIDRQNVIISRTKEIWSEFYPVPKAEICSSTSENVGVQKKKKKNKNKEDQELPADSVNEITSTPVLDRPCSKKIKKDAGLVDDPMDDSLSTFITEVKKGKKKRKKLKGDDLPESTGDAFSTPAVEIPKQKKKKKVKPDSDFSESGVDNSSLHSKKCKNNKS